MLNTYPLEREIVNETMEATSHLRTKLVISDCHLSAGRVFEGRLNLHEDFHFDKEMVEFFQHFSSGKYAELDVECIINGDFLDFLNVPKEGEFQENITEDLAVWKLERIIEGHPKVMEAIKQFASKPKKKVTYLIGNHDADLVFPRVREGITRAWDPEGRYPSPVVECRAGTDRYPLGEKCEIRHGNQFEAVHLLNFEHPIIDFDPQEPPVLNIPWGSYYVLKIVNRMKWERDYIDKVRPVKLFVVIGLFVDTWFTLRFVFSSLYYFFKTRFISSPKRRSHWRVTAEMLRPEPDFLLDLERQARRLLDQEPKLKTVIFGHTHKPMDKVYPDGKQYINTGTWTKMINLDWRNLGQRFCLTFAYIEMEDEVVLAELREWRGETGPHVRFKT